MLMRFQTRQAIMAWSGGEEEEGVTIGHPQRWRGVRTKQLHQHTTITHKIIKSKLSLPRPPMAFPPKLLCQHDHVGMVVDTLLSCVRDPTGT